MLTILEILASKGWIVEKAEPSEKRNELRTMFPGVPDDILDFLESFSLCASANNTQWFIPANAYFHHTETGFNWNEFELMSLEAADGDRSWQDEISAFWSEHMPIYLSVDGFYLYYAVHLKTGEIFYGAEPEFVNTLFVAKDFGEFKKYILENGPDT